MFEFKLLVTNTIDTYGIDAHLTLNKGKAIFAFSHSGAFLPSLTGLEIGSKNGLSLKSRRIVVSVCGNKNLFQLKLSFQSAIQVTVLKPLITLG